MLLGAYSDNIVYLCKHLFTAVSIAKMSLVYFVIAYKLLIDNVDPPAVILIEKL